ncbi:MAG: ROK family protein [Actinomycetota bacterium]
MSERGLAVGVDVGGTKATAALVDASGRILDRARTPTPTRDLDAALDALVGIVRRVRPGHEPVGIGVPGLVDVDGVMRSGANVAWVDAPIRERMSAILGLEVAVDNDCTAGAFGEWRAGAARGVSNVLYIGLGTGIGGGLVLGGRLYRGSHGFAGEIGHMIVEPGGERCGCGNLGCWETVASGTAIAREGRRAVSRHPHSALAVRAGDGEAVTGEMVTEAAERGDPTARGILAEVGTRLGEGIAGLVNVLDPDVVVVGGGAARAGDHLLDPARARFAAVIEGGPRRPLPAIVPAAMGSDSAVVGIALMALEEPA